MSSLGEFRKYRRNWDSKLLNVANEISIYNLATRKRLLNANLPPSYKPSYYEQMGFVNYYGNPAPPGPPIPRFEHAFPVPESRPPSRIFLNRYHPKFAYEQRVRPFRQQKPKQYKKKKIPKKFRKNCCLAGAYYECDCDKTKTKEETALREIPVEKMNTNGHLNENVEPVDMDAVENGIVNYCLDREIQHYIHRRQNDFKLTEKYKAFVLCELPRIKDFQPVPETTQYKLNDRFKCLFRQLLKENPAENEESLEDKLLEDLTLTTTFPSFSFSDVDNLEK